MMQIGKALGMQTLNDALVDLVKNKVVAPEEAYVKAVDKAGFEAMLKRMAVDTKFLAPTAQPVRTRQVQVGRRSGIPSIRHPTRDSTLPTPGSRIPTPTPDSRYTLDVIRVPVPRTMPTARPPRCRVCRSRPAWGRCWGCSAPTVPASRRR